MIVTKNRDGTYTLTPEGDEGGILTWAEANHDPNIIRSILDGFLRSERGHRSSSAGQVAIRRIATPPLTEIEAAVQQLQSLSVADRTALLTEIKVLRGGA